MADIHFPRLQHLAEGHLDEAAKSAKLIAKELTKKSRSVSKPDKKSVTTWLKTIGATSITHSSKNWNVDGQLGDYQSGDFELDGVKFYYSCSYEFGMPMTISDKPLKQG